MLHERGRQALSPLAEEPDWTGDEKPPVVCMHVSDSTATPKNVAAFIDRLNGGLTTQATHLKRLLAAAAGLVELALVTRKHAQRLKDQKSQQ